MRIPVLVILSIGILLSSCSPNDGAQAHAPVHTLIFGGDVMLSRVVGKKLAKQGWDTALADVAAKFAEADIAFVNLESPFHPKPLYQLEGATFRADKQTVASLTHAGIDIVSLANNHIGDGTREGMSFTREVLDEAGILHVGLGDTPEDAASMRVIAKDGIRYGFLAFSDITPTYAATAKRAGYAKMLPLPEMAELLTKSEDHADVLIVSLHTGAEYRDKPSQKLVTYARGLIDAGATLVIGHHPHVIQDVEMYNGGVIAYSLGNLVFDQIYPGTKRGLVLEVDMQEHKVTSIRKHGVCIRDYYRPEFVPDTSVCAK